MLSRRYLETAVQRCRGRLPTAVALARPFASGRAATQRQCATTASTQPLPSVTCNALRGLRAQRPACCAVCLQFSSSTLPFRGAFLSTSRESLLPALLLPRRRASIMSAQLVLLLAFSSLCLLDICFAAQGGGSVSTPASNDWVLGSATFYDAPDQFKKARMSDAAPAMRPSSVACLSEAGGGTATR